MQEPSIAYISYKDLIIICTFACQPLGLYPCTKGMGYERVVILLHWRNKLNVHNNYYNDCTEIAIKMGFFFIILAS